MNRIVIIIPTYNEKGNIAGLITKINSIEPAADILVVDDNSPDGTGKLVESIAKINPSISILHRKRKEGLGPAYLEAFRYVLRKNRYDYIVQMDSDFSHNPEDIIRLLNTAMGGCDVAVGSRYVEGGGVSEKWNIFRKLLSRLGNSYAGFITGMNINDCTTGFRCWKAQALGSLDLDKKFLNGYGFLIHMLYEAHKNKSKICEVPIFFGERREGSSKMKASIILEAFCSLTFICLKDALRRRA